MTEEQLKEINNDFKKANRMVLLGAAIAKQGCTYYKDKNYSKDLKHRVGILENAVKNVHNVFIHRPNVNQDDISSMQKEIKSNEVYFVSEIVNLLAFFDEEALEELYNQLLKL
jgi:hypothetical protein